MSLQTSLASFITRLGGEFKSVRTAITNKLDIPAASGASGFVLTKTNSVAGAGGTFTWATLPGRSTPIFIYGPTVSSAFSNPNLYLANDLYLDFQTGRLWFLNYTDGTTNSWIIVTTLALAANYNTKPIATGIAIALGS